ncbi:hypothetical protein BRADI_3g37090v3 [Brachypodium distachyon]|uniref:Uncharacterized protein n=1 Tax=Brachypodium distachyon TaxID=15368 RepID=I1I7G6_BRADI|nr:hypothetical protein BRADI_3g37090v3 [Brachypodium distachyon]
MAAETKEQLGFGSEHAAAAKKTCAGCYRDRLNAVERAAEAARMGAELLGAPAAGALQEPPKATTETIGTNSTCSGCRIEAGLQLGLPLRSRRTTRVRCGESWVGVESGSSARSVDGRDAARTCACDSSGAAGGEMGNGGSFQSHFGEAGSVRRRCRCCC